ncbi:MAG: TIGR03619 family F420-dependent LLM class oxidoreductase [Chloroflexi bacterium]|nr:TIGR03619 family F420-dependent LLM class oxidoreductase [Chloroflexota bacterium]
MDFGVALPFGPGASIEAVEAAADVAEGLGWDGVWVTDHLLVDRDDGGDYGWITEAITTLAYLAARTKRVRLGASVFVVPARNAVVLGKELATVDAFSRGRLIAGVGVGWSDKEFSNVGVSDHFHVRGAYTEETIRLWRHLWSGSSQPFEGRFHSFQNAEFGPLPTWGAQVPIWIGGRDPRALRRAGRLADAYHSSATPPGKYSERIPVITAAAEVAGRPAPRWTARARVRLGEKPADADRFYAIRGSADEVVAEIEAWKAIGVDYLVLSFGETDADGVTRAIERFDREIRPRV